MQIWNLDFNSDNYSLFLTFMISNLGNGNLNNGVTIYLYDKMKHSEYLKTLEFTNQHLKAQEKQFYIKIENDNSLIYNNDELQIKVNSGKDNSFDINTKIKLPINSNTTVSSKFDFKNQNIYYKILYIYPQTIQFIYRGKEVSSFGSIGLECILSTDDPLNFANSFYFIRNFDPKYKFFLFYVDYKKITENPISKIHLNFNENTLHPKTMNYKEDTILFEFSNCKVFGKKINYLGGFDILNHVSFMLRWFLKLLRIDPFIKHYRTFLETDCGGDPIQFKYSQLTHIGL
ncbi:MAG: hypothetical protein ACK4UJ_04930 [Leptonema sp. (in: bacteria)]